MKHVVVLLCFGLLTISCGSEQNSSSLYSEFESSRFPTGPNESMTPGETCRRPDTLRYPEQIPYCTRDVSTGEKNAIIATYDREFGFEIGRMGRSEFKIDHYIPLCMGGSNSSKNLWPQHKSVYAKTDPLEPKLCELMAAGKMLQRVAMEKMRQAKNHLDEAEDLIREADQLLGRAN